jgi:hypothetical protein
LGVSTLTVGSQKHFYALKLVTRITDCGSIVVYGVHSKTPSLAVLDAIALASFDPS